MALVMSDARFARKTRANLYGRLLALPGPPEPATCGPKMLWAEAFAGGHWGMARERCA